MGEPLLLAAVVHLALHELGARALEGHRELRVRLERLASRARSAASRSPRAASRRPRAARADGERPRRRRVAAGALEALDDRLRASGLTEGEGDLGAIAVQPEAQRMARPDPLRQRRRGFELLARFDDVAGRERDEAEDLPVQDRDDEVARIRREPQALAERRRASSIRPWSASTRAIPRSAKAGQSSAPSRSYAASARSAHVRAAAQSPSHACMSETWTSQNGSSPPRSARRWICSVSFASARLEVVRVAGELVDDAVGALPLPRATALPVQARAPGDVAAAQAGRHLERRIRAVEERRREDVLLHGVARRPRGYASPRRSRPGCAPCRAGRGGTRRGAAPSRGRAASRRPPRAPARRGSSRRPDGRGSTRRARAGSSPRRARRPACARRARARGSRPRGGGRRGRGTPPAPPGPPAPAHAPDPPAESARSRARRARPRRARRRGRGRGPPPAPGPRRRLRPGRRLLPRDGGPARPPSRRSRRASRGSAAAPLRRAGARTVSARSGWPKRTVAPSRRTIPAATAGWRAAGAAPARVSVSTVGSNAAAARTSALRVRAGSAATRSRVSAASVVGTGSGCPGSARAASLERASDLERVERIAAARLRDPGERQARERVPEPCDEHPVQRRDGERAELEARESGAPERVAQLERIRHRALVAHRRAGSRPASRRAGARRRRGSRPSSRRATGRRRARRAAASRPSRARGRDSPWRRRAPAGRRSPALPSARRSATSSARRCGEGRSASSSGRDVTEQVAEAPEGKRRVCACGARGEHAEAVRPGECGARLPDRRLADSRLADDHRARGAACAPASSSRSRASSSGARPTTGSSPVIASAFSRAARSAVGRGSARRRRGQLDAVAPPTGFASSWSPRSPPKKRRASASHPGGAASCTWWSATSSVTPARLPTRCPYPGRLTKRSSVISWIAYAGPSRVFPDSRTPP